MTLRVLACLTGVLAFAGVASAQGLAPINLRCEYHTDPLGIGEPQPRLSWELRPADPTRRGQKQAAYQVLVASSEARLKADEADLWDSGKVGSAATNQIAYSGKPLVSRQQCWWKLRTWNERGEASSWSLPARWTMGLLQRSDWQAKWIGYDAPNSRGTAVPPVSLEGAKWIWHKAYAPAKAKGDGGQGQAQAGQVELLCFRGAVSLGTIRVTSATLLLTADDHADVYVNGQQVARIETWRKLHRLDITPHLKLEQNVIAIAVDNDPRSPGGVVGRLRVEFASGNPAIFNIDANWRVSAREQAGWREPNFDDSAWPRATEITAFGDEPWGKPGEGLVELPPPPQLRKRFSAEKPLRRATLYASALGLYQLWLNGHRVGDIVFAPGWTEYKKRVYYNTYDVTAHMRGGENVIAGLLGDGWYAGYVGYGGKRNLYGGEPRLLVQLEIEYEDGSRQVIASDDTWKAGYGPVREADLLMGCTYDAREEKPWMRVEFDDSQWDSAIVGEDYPGLIQAYPGAPVRLQEEIPAKKVTRTGTDTYIFDLGQNMVGWVRLRAKAKQGQPVVIKQAEMLADDGTLYTTALRGARATDTYIPARDGEFEFEPVFTFHGFRYVEVSGLEAPPTAEAVTGMVVHSAMNRAGWIETSSPLVNQLCHNILWGQKGNYLEVPMDCPQRDERLGWTGDAQFFMNTAAYNFDAAAFFTKWLVDLNQDSQNQDGAFASVAPDVLDFHGAGATGWADAGIICPHAIWRFYGDIRVIERHWDSMARYLDYLERTSKDLIRTQGAYGDWVNLGGGAKSEVIGTAYFAYVARLMSEMAAALGKDSEAQRYSDLSQRIREAFIREFVGQDGGIKDSSQTGYALAFTMDLLPPERREAAAQRFVEEIAARDWHLATGFIGTPRLLPSLTAAGRNDVAYRLLMNETYPSWLFQVKLGATTMWERWDGWTPEKGFQDAGMNSFNHYAFGSVGEWLYATVAGIQSDGPGFRKIIIRPQPGPELDWVNARYESINGRIVSEWKIEGDRLKLRVQIPPNTTARVFVPTSDPQSVVEGGKPAAEADGLKALGPEDGAAVFEIGSGSYEFLAVR